MRDRIKCLLLTAVLTIAAFFFMAAYVGVMAGAMFFVMAMRLLPLPSLHSFTNRRSRI